MPAGGSGSHTMQIVAVTNIKGGVGKTTTAVNLAYLAARDGQATVLWDLDPQGAATYLLGGEANERASARKLVRGWARDPDAPLPGLARSAPPGARNRQETPTAGGCRFATLL